MAAWRSGGISALPFKSALPAAVAPNRSLAAGILTLFSFFTCRKSKSLLYIHVYFFLNKVILVLN
jgi:hypothetical protein